MFPHRTKEIQGSERDLHIPFTQPTIGYVKGEFEQTRYPGIYKRHKRTCPAIGKPKAKCRCSSHIVRVHSGGRLINRTFPTLEAARTWQSETQLQVARGERKAPTKQTLALAWERIEAGMRSGEVVNRSQHEYALLTIERYDQAMRLYVLPELGGRRVSDITRDDVERIVGKMRRKKASASTIKNALTPLQVIYRDRLVQREAPVSPVLGVRSPPRRAREGRVVMPDEARRLIDAIPDERIRCFWALCFFAGLRRTVEALSLTKANVDLEADVIHVVRSKTRAGIRDVPILPDLRRILEPRLAAIDDDDLIVGLDQTWVRRASIDAWARSGIERVTAHDARKTFASVLAEAGVDVETMTQLLGHADYRVTRDHYIRALPGAQERLRQRLRDAFDTLSG